MRKISWDGDTCSLGDAQEIGSLHVAVDNNSGLLVGVYMPPGDSKPLSMACLTLDAEEELYKKLCERRKERKTKKGNEK